MLALILAALLAQSPAPPAASPAPDPARLRVDGATPTPLSLTLEDLASLPRTSVTLKEDGADVVYEGVRVAEILGRAGAPSGNALRGAALTTGVVAEAKDGYRVLFTLAEFDAEFGNHDVIVADRRNGRPLFDYQGPFRLIAPRDRRGARGVRMLTRLTVVQMSAPAASR